MKSSYKKHSDIEEGMIKKIEAFKDIGGGVHPSNTYVSHGFI